MKEYSRFTNELRKTVPKQSLKDVGAVFFIFLLLPYICVLFFPNPTTKDQWKASIYDNNILVKRASGSGVEVIPMEDYLIGLTAANIPLDVEKETLKAQITILRTCIMNKAQREEQTYYANEKDLKLAYLTLEQMRSMWEEEYESMYNMLKQLIQETKGIVITYEKQPIDASFFAISAGSTRNGEEVFGNKNYPYLQSVESSGDIFSEDYLQLETIKKEKVERLLKEAFGQDLFTEEEVFSLEIQQCDSAGYVLSIKVGSQLVSGEEFRKILGLKSSYFQIEQEQDSLKFTTKGLGHGLGFSQYGANKMASSGADFVSLLKYYYTQIEIEKIE